MIQSIILIIIIIALFYCFAMVAMIIASAILIWVGDIKIRRHQKYILMRENRIDKKCKKLLKGKRNEK